YFLEFSFLNSSSCTSESVSGLTPDSFLFLRFLLHFLIHEQPCQENKYICLKKYVKNIEIETHRYRYDKRDDGFQKFHHHESGKHISEESHTQRQGSDHDLKDHDRGDHRDRTGKMFYPVLQSVLMNT